MFNVRGLKPRTTPSKVGTISDLLHDQSQLFIGLTETWLSDHVDAEINIEGYQVFRGDRKSFRQKRGRGSGGVAFYVRDDAVTNTETIMSFSNGVVESLGIHIKYWNLVVYLVYRSPDDSSHCRQSGYREFNQALEAIKNSINDLPTPTPDIIISGDFNLPNADWSQGVCKAGSNRVKEEEKMVSALHNLATDNFLLQQIEKPTHRDGNILDLLFTNNTDLVHSYSSSYSRVSDHNVLEIKAHYKMESPHGHQNDQDEVVETPSFYKLNFFSDRIDWDHFNYELNSIDWIREFRGLNVDDMLSKFITTCQSIANELVPKQKRLTKSLNRIPRHRRVLMRTRRRINTQLTKSPCEARRRALMKRLVTIETRLQKSHQDEEERRERKAVENITVNSKYFFSYAKSFSKIKTGIGPLMDAAGTLVSTAKGMASILSEQYQSVFSKPRFDTTDSYDIFPDIYPESPSISNVLFAEDELLDAIKEVSTNSAAGPDEFPAMILKQCSNAIVTPLCMIWRKSLSTGVIPAQCKMANIVPIHKGKSRAIPKNYRPVALTSLLIKVFEKVIRRHLVSYMEETHQFNPSQHGFRGGRSCLSQLLEHFDLVTRRMEEGKTVDVIYLDFAKAFDKVDMGITLRKLKKIGINGMLGRWLHCFLTGRYQRVIVNGTKSDPVPVVSGVPQGSVLGPLLFLILIGDIDQDVATSFISSFADDTRVGHEISSKDDCRLLQQDLQAVFDWANANNMEFNSDKFEHLRYSPCSTKMERHVYLADTGSPIEEKDSLRDLGVTLSNDGSFSMYIKEKAAKMKSKIGWVLRTFKTRELLPMMTLWKQLILSDHDYCSQLWSPDKIGDIQLLEMLQRSYLRKVQGLQGLSYWEQLRLVKMYSLERRRERYIAIYVWKILEGMVPNISTSHGIAGQWHARRGRSCQVPYILATASHRTRSIRFSSFAIKGPRIFNSLPMHLRNFSGGTVNQFKCRLDKHLKSVPDEPLIPGYTAYRTVDSNSLIDWHSHISRHLREDPKVQSRLRNALVDVPGSP